MVNLVSSLSMLVTAADALVALGPPLNEGGHCAYCETALSRDVARQPEAHAADCVWAGLKLRLREVHSVTDGAAERYSQKRRS